MKNEIAHRDRQQSAGIDIRGIDDLMRFAGMVVKARLAPRGLDTVEAVALAVQYGLEIGLSPMQAVQSIMVTNGRPSIYGDAMLAIVRASGLLQSIEERIEGEGDARAALCVVQRVGCKPRTQRFTVADAKRAGLWGKMSPNGHPSPWVTYSDRMLVFRARSWALRDEFGDVLKGLISWEEDQDMQVLAPAARPDEPMPEPTPEPVMLPPPTLSGAQLGRIEELAREKGVPGPTLSGAQLGRIEELAREKGVPGPMLSGAIRRYSVASIDFLTPSQADELIARLEKFPGLPAASPPPTPSPTPEPPATIPMTRDDGHGDGHGDAWEPPQDQVPPALADRR